MRTITLSPGLITIILVVYFSFEFDGYCQSRITIPDNFKNVAKKYKPATIESQSNSSGILAPGEKSTNYLEEEPIGLTWYDLQTNASNQNRIFAYDDGTIGAVFTYGVDVINYFSDRGTAYNYYDGNEWGPYPTQALEPDRAGWPSYAPYGENGEIIVSHYSGADIDGLAVMVRDEKGTGDWQISNFQGPLGFEDLIWPRMTTGGVGNSVIHLIALTKPVSPYMGIDGALLYSRSSDGTTSWDPANLLLEGINSNYFNHIDGDTYSLQARGDVVAFTVGDSWTDFVLMKSTDGGDTWTKTVIWEHPYPLYNIYNPFQTDTFYCVDGSHALTIDQDYKIHVTFGINRTYSDGASTFWFPLVGGLAYWNEDREAFTNNINALNPYDDGNYTELIENYSLIGWEQDINGNGEWDILGNPGAYYIGSQSMPTIYIDEFDIVYIIWSAITETFDNGLQDYRHIWYRYSGNGGNMWGQFYDLTGDLSNVFQESVFPSLAQRRDNFLYLSYQFDYEPGLAISGDEDPYSENLINFLPIPLYVGINNQEEGLNVSEVYPNPTYKQANLKIDLTEQTQLSYKISNLMGQVVYTANEDAVTPGMTHLRFDVSNFSSGVYFLTIKANERSISRKFMVE